MSKYINFGPGWLAYIVNIPAYFPPICPFCRKPMKPAFMAGLDDAIQYYSDAVSAEKPTYICMSMVPNPHYKAAMAKQQAAQKRNKHAYMGANNNPGPKMIPCKNHYLKEYDAGQKRIKVRPKVKFVKSYFTGLPVKFDPFE